MTKTSIKPFPTAHNLVLELQDHDHYVSFNPSIGTNEPFGAVILAIADAVSGESSIGQPETALKYDDKWYNLRDDHRAGIEEAYNEHGIVAVLQYFFSRQMDWTGHSTGTVEDILKSINAL